MATEKNGAGVSRRTVLKGAALGGAGLVGGGALLSSCGKKKLLEMSIGQLVVAARPVMQSLNQ